MKSTSTNLCWFHHINTSNNWLIQYSATNKNNALTKNYVFICNSQNRLGQTSCRLADNCLAVWPLRYKGAKIMLRWAAAICWTCCKRWMLQDFTLNTWTEEPIVSFTPIWFKEISLWQDLIVEYHHAVTGLLASEMQWALVCQKPLVGPHINISKANVMKNDPYLFCING